MLKVMLNEVIYLLLPYRPLQYPFCKIPDNLAHRRDMSISHNINTA
jgi:hypothetical protein